MKAGDNPNWFTNNPLARLNQEKDQTDFIRERLRNPDSLLIPLHYGAPLISGGKAAFLSAAAISEFPKDAPLAFLGLQNDRAYFAIEAGAAGANGPSAIAEAPPAANAPFADIGEYTPLRVAMTTIGEADAAIIGHGCWLLDWQRKHRFCPACGARTRLKPGGAKSVCPDCDSEHFPRTNPVAIVLAVHDNSCLLGRGPHFPPGFLSALAGYIEAGETPEEGAARELFEEAGVTLTNVRYQFSQPWPFTASLMMGFFADTTDRALSIDADEIEEARWISRTDICAVLNGETRDFSLAPKFTIARQLLERWAAQ